MRYFYVVFNIIGGGVRGDAGMNFTCDKMFNRQKLLEYVCERCPTPNITLDNISIANIYEMSKSDMEQFAPNYADLTGVV